MQALRTAYDELSVPVDTARWHALLFTRPQTAAEGSVSSVATDATHMPASGEVGEGDSVAAAKADLFAAAIEQVLSVLACEWSSLHSHALD